MIEYRASLCVDMLFEGGFKLKKGTVIYVSETEEGWLGMYYEEKGSGHGFALNEIDFSIWTSPDGENEIVLMKREPEDEAELARIREIEIEQARKRVDARSRALGEATAELEALLYG